MTRMGKVSTSHNAASDTEPLPDANASQGVSYKHWPQPCMGYVQWCALKWSHFMSRISHTAPQTWMPSRVLYEVYVTYAECADGLSVAHFKITLWGWSSVFGQIWQVYITLHTVYMHQYHREGVGTESTSQYISNSDQTVWEEQLVIGN